MIMLKPLDQAIRDNDPIRAVISGTGINQDGKTPGITMPSGEAQGLFYIGTPLRMPSMANVISRDPHGKGLSRCRS